MMCWFAAQKCATDIAAVRWSRSNTRRVWVLSCAHEVSLTTMRSEPLLAITERRANVSSGEIRKWRIFSRPLCARSSPRHFQEDLAATEEMLHRVLDMLEEVHARIRCFG
jgi:hypothetical protein